MTGNPMAAGAQQQRRALMQQPQQGPPLLPLPLFNANPMQQPQQQQSPPPYVGMSVSSMGLTMNMSDMESSIRAYQPMPSHQQHQEAYQHHQSQHYGPVASGPPPPSAHDGSSMAFWRGQGVDASAGPYAKAGGGAGLEFEIGDILGSSNSSNSNADERDVETAAADVSMAAMGSSFEVAGFGDHHMHAGSVKQGYQHQHASSSQSHQMLLRQQQQIAIRAGAVVVTGAFDNPDQARLARSDSNASSGAGGEAVGVSEGPVATSNNNEYSRFVETRDGPDLSQQKIDAKNEKCQFHNCPNRARVSQAYGKFCNRHVIVAPCGFPGCRDKALLNASMCEKHLQEGKDALHKVLATRAQNVPVCRTFGCFKNDQGRGYCRGHEKLLMATGRLPKHVNKRRLNSAYTMCSYPGCDKHSQRHHLCRTHGNLISKQAEELHTRSNGETYEEILLRLQQNVRKCTNPTCTKNSQRDRLCTMHYYEKLNPPADGASGDASSEQQSEAAVPAPGTEAAPVCSVSDCNMQAMTKGVCKYHSGQGQKPKKQPVGSDAATAAAVSGIREVEPTRCNVADCVQVSYSSGMCLQHFNQHRQQLQQQQRQQQQLLQQQQQQQQQMQQQHYQHQQQQEQERGHSVQGSRYSSSVISPFGDERFNTPMDPTLPSRSGMESYYPGGSAYGAPMDPNMSSYPPMSSSERHLSGPGPSSGESEAKQALFSLNAKLTDPGRAYNPHDEGVVYRSGSVCSNLICNRQTYGREYCDSCQNMAPPLVGDSLSGEGGVGASSYAYSASAQPDPETSPQGWGDAAPQTKLPLAKAYEVCRVGQCGAIVPSLANGGLCDLHFRAFEAGDLSVDELMLRSKVLEKENHASAAAAAGGNKSPTGGKGRKYFCKTDGCGKQAQRKGLCKRHLRLHEQETSAKKAKIDSASDFASPNQASAVISQTTSTPCRFPRCSQLVGRNAPWLCTAHANASFCWQPGCENIVDGPQFCEPHSYHKHCAYEGCAQAAHRDFSGCTSHAMERRCSHEHCDKFTVGTTGVRCRLHQISCKEEPCALCELHGLGSENVIANSTIKRPAASRDRTGAGGKGDSRWKANSENLQAGGNQ